MVPETIFEKFYKDGQQWMPNYGKCSYGFSPVELKKNILLIILQNRGKKSQVPFKIISFLNLLTIIVPNEGYRYSRNALLTK